MKNYIVRVYCEGQLVHTAVVTAEARWSELRIQAAAMVSCRFMFRGREATYEIVEG